MSAPPPPPRRPRGGKERAVGAVGRVCWEGGGAAWGRRDTQGTERSEPSPAGGGGAGPAGAQDHRGAGFLVTHGPETRFAERCRPPKPWARSHPPLLTTPPRPRPTGPQPPLGPHSSPPRWPAFPEQACPLPLPGCCAGPCPRPGTLLRAQPHGCSRDSSLARLSLHGTFPPRPPGP